MIEPSLDRDRGPYDPEGGTEDDLWFLPEDAAGSDPLAPPMPRAERQLFDPAEWRAAQGMLAAELAQVALRFGMLEERLAGMGEGARHRLALREVADLGWWTGDRIGADRLALWVAARAGMAQDDAPALARAGWAVRRLTAGTGPYRGVGERGWLTGAEQATLSALAQLDRLRIWQSRAQEAIVDLSGRTPLRLIAALVAWPALSVPMAAQLTGASRAAVQRNLDRFAARGFVREITGQGRFRMWTANYSGVLP